MTKTEFKASKKQTIHILKTVINEIKADNFIEANSFMDFSTCTKMGMVHFKDFCDYMIAQQKKLGD